jgi:hypothetical protein
LQSKTEWGLFPQPAVVLMITDFLSIGLAA